MTKTYGPYRLLRSDLPAEPVAYGRGGAYVAGENLPTMRLVFGGDYAIAFAGSHDDNDASAPYLINTVPHYMRIDLKHYADIGWALSTGEGNTTGWHSLSLKRSDVLFGGDPSDAARRFVLSTILPALVAWLSSDEAAPLLAHGKASVRLEAIQRATRKVAEAQKALDAAQAELATAEAA